MDGMVLDSSTSSSNSLITPYTITSKLRCIKKLKMAVKVKIILVDDLEKIGFTDCFTPFSFLYAFNPSRVPMAQW